MASGPQSSTSGGSFFGGFPTPSFADFTKLFAEMKLPALPDMEAFVAANRRNMEAITAANRIALEGAQAVSRRHMEIMQQSMSEMTEAVKMLAAPDAPQAKAARQAELLKKIYEQAVSNIRELGDLIQKSNAEAIALLNTRFTEALDEVKALAEPRK
jgi:phasin family protein